jgi:hypothetical protein
LAAPPRLHLLLPNLRRLLPGLRLYLRSPTPRRWCALGASNEFSGEFSFVDLSSGLRRFLLGNHCWCIHEPSHGDSLINQHSNLSDL